MACIRTTKNWFVIDKEGNKLFTLPDGHRPASVNEYGAIEPMYSNEPSDFNYIAAMVTDKKCVNHIINKKGVIMFSNDKGMFGQMRPFVSKGDKAYAVWDYEGKGAVMDITLKLIVVHDLENLGYLDDFNDNWFLWSDCDVCSSKKWMIDWKGNELLFYWGTSFNEGLAVLTAQEYGISGYINEYGEIVVRFVDTQF